MLSECLAAGVGGSSHNFNSNNDDDFSLIKTVGLCSWKLKSSNACVTTHWFNYYALQMDDA